MNDQDLRQWRGEFDIVEKDLDEIFYKPGTLPREVISRADGLTEKVHTKSNSYTFHC